jgi:hypothetical protein
LGRHCGSTSCGASQGQNESGSYPAARRALENLRQTGRGRTRAEPVHARVNRCGGRGAVTERDRHASRENDTRFKCERHASPYILSPPIGRFVTIHYRDRVGESPRDRYNGAGPDIFANLIRHRHGTCPPIGGAVASKIHAAGSNDTFTVAIRIRRAQCLRHRGRELQRNGIAFRVWGFQAGQRPAQGGKGIEKRAEGRRSVGQQAVPKRDS